MFAVIIVVAPATAAAINPARVVGPMLIQQIAGGEVLWGQLPVYLIAELLAGVVAALLYGVLSRTPADGGGTEDQCVDLGAPESAVTETSSSDSVSSSTGSRKDQS